jgi:hypothetical protein
MENPWDLRLVVDAHDLDTVRVRPRRFGNGPQVHLMVRTGPVVVYCLDGAAVRSVAAAWAQAQAGSAHTLPADTPRRRPPANQPKGVAWPTADVVAEGAQRWEVSGPHPGQPYATVTTDWLTVRIHDRRALQSYTHAWAGACALAIKVMPDPPEPFDLLLRDAYDREFLHRYHQEHPKEARSRRR